MPSLQPEIIDLSEPSARTYSYTEIQQLISQYKSNLLQMGFPYQSRIALVGQNSVLYFAALLGIRQAGHIAVPLNYKASPDQLKQLLSHAQAAFAICDQNRLSDVGPLVKSTDFQSCLKAQINAQEAPSQVGSDRLALIIYTSGSTGVHKGVAISERARRSFVVASALQNQNESSSPGGQTRAIVSTPMSHVLALNMLESLFAMKASIVLLPKFDPQNFVRAIQQYKVNKVSMVPSMWAMILQNKDQMKSIDLSSVQHIYFSSEPLSQRLYEEARQHFKNATIENSYGISEAGPNLFGPHPDGVPRPGLSVGYPRRGISYRLVDGELEIKTPFMLTEYYRQPELNQQALTPDGFYKTKDKFHVDENGYYFFKGRSDGMMLSGGENIYPSEIVAILERHPEVKSCAVIALADEVKGEKPYAFVVRIEGSKITEDELKKFVLANGPSYLHPRRIWFLPELPQNDNLKVDLRRLKEMASDFLRT